jgi:hypothetical protein
MTPHLRSVTARVNASSGSCQSVVERLHAVLTSGDIHLLLGARVVEVQVTGVTAVAEVRSGAHSSPTRLRKLRGVWLMDLFAATG